MYIHVHVYNATTNTNYTSQTTVAQWVSNKIKIKHSFGAPFGLRQDIITTIHVYPGGKVREIARDARLRRGISQ